ncbi:MAG TPA: tRNA (N6-isopentenyl adenosine(37)-C2)-methylthiotransferase MiaB [Elusimicrobiota bacterium]|jgi:tRNA-2-methylthio-N6-dimethylallyladenosine synthase|nr:tRNA (N6-isopentenyl adenosine(37)-C2)-methylthiotransferase MiaB [Elusimicrobiota bacterium]
MRLHVISFGCQMSVADGEEMARPLLARGFSLAPDVESASAVILNTCTVRQHAEDRALSEIGRLKTWKDGDPSRLLIVAGCAAERLGGWIEERFPHVDLVVGAKSIESYPEIVGAALARRFNWSRENAGAWAPEHDAPIASPVSAYLTIMRGCNYSCTYCIVPAVRGRELYRPLDAILAEARARVAGGARELVLLGQTVNSYRGAGGEDFAELLRRVGAESGALRIRFMSPHPFFLNERMARAMAETPQVMPHLHLPVQSGSDRLLKAMRRNYTRAQFLDKLAALRALIPGLELTTDFIAGFPGETEEDFTATLSLVEEADIQAAYCFKFSPREGTEAATMDGEPPEQIKEERLARLLELVEARTRRALARRIGRRFRVLLETATDGRTEGYFKARLGAPGTPGDLVEAEAVSATRTALACRAVVMQA